MFYCFWPLVEDFDQLLVSELRLEGSDAAMALKERKTVEELSAGSNLLSEQDDDPAAAGGADLLSLFQVSGLLM